MNSILYSILGIVIAVCLFALYFLAEEGKKGDSQRILTWVIVAIITLLALIYS